MTAPAFLQDPAAAAQFVRIVGEELARRGRRQLTPEEFAFTLDWDLPSAKAAMGEPAPRPDHLRSVGGGAS
jgi:hypothetical protein